MAFSGRSVELSYIKEVTQGVTPSGNLQILKNTGDGLNRITNNVTSEIVDNNRNVEDRRQVSNGANGSIDSELFLKNNVAFEESALFANSVAVSDSFTGTTISSVASGNKYTTDDGDFTALGLSVGQAIKVAGFSNSNNNGVKVILSISTLELAVFGGEALTDETAPGAITYTGSRIENGNTQITYSIEKKIIGDPTSYFRAFKGMMVNTLTYDIPVRDKITTSSDFLGYEVTVPASTIGTGYIAKTDDEMVDSSHNIKLYVDGISQAYTAINLSINNNLREQAVVGSEALEGIGDGIQDVTITTSLFFEDNAEYTKFINNTNFSFTMIITDNDGNVKVISLPKCKYVELDEPNGGNDSDFVQNFTIGAIKGNDDFQISIDNHFV